ncbi:MAG: glycine betaine/L-proline ABC transporter substrate-binding protein ProX [Acidimicrobiaceae bacterium]|nr:glycine betaine/L-proline ABC transporter substrate-binding protein ProX [Acidimicrobiaceae bacterium]
MSVRKNSRRMCLWLVGLAVTALFATACGGNESDTDTTTTVAEADDVSTTTTVAEADDVSTTTTVAEGEAPSTADSETTMPGEGVSVRMARGNWSAGYLQARIYHDLLEELGYDVTDPSDLELPPSSAYISMAEGEFDFWPNSWVQLHGVFLNGTLTDGTRVRDHVSTIGSEMIEAGLQGFLTNKSLVEEHGITTIDDILNSPELVAIYDAADTTPGDGIIQLLGCPTGWGCQVTIEETIQIAGWDNIEQIEVGTYDPLIAEAVARADDGKPFIVYSWTPSSYLTKLRPGDNVMWLALEESSVHDGSISPELDQRGAPAAIELDKCTADPCYLAFKASDILVAANNDFLANNPAAEKLLELVQISVVDVTLQNVRYDGGENTEEDVARHAAEWIAENREQVDEWLTEARAAA